MRRALLLVSLVVACGSEAEPSPAPPSPDELRGVLGQASVRCEGVSVDPPELEALAARGAGDLEGTITAMEALVGANAGSATARVRLGELLLRTEPPRADRAARWFGLALALGDRGCTLRERDHWASLEGAAISRMMQGDHAGAIPFLRRSLARWPAARSTRYNLACGLCASGELDACERELRAVLRANEPGPAFLGAEQRPAGHYERLIREDPDLTSLRADPERWTRLLGD